MEEGMGDEALPQQLYSLQNLMKRG